MAALPIFSAVTPLSYGSSEFLLSSVCGLGSGLISLTARGIPLKQTMCEICNIAPCKLWLTPADNLASQKWVYIVT